VIVEGATVGEVIENLEQRFAGTKDRLCRNGSLRPGISVVVGGSVSGLGLLRRVSPDDEIHFLPSLGGG
jgi:molybdopterin synthase sulfur carrier subunit